MSQRSVTSPERRSFLTRLNTGAAAVAAVALGGQALAQTKTTVAGRFEPARHDQDNWMDELPGKHRIVFDTTTHEGMANALRFADNYMIVNRASYGLQNSDMAVIILARHLSTTLGFNDAMWAKYGTQMSSMSRITTEAKTNPRLASGLSSLTGQGVQIAVCSMATSGLAEMIAEATKAGADAVLADLTANLIPNARMVPAGIVAVSRAQERGYTLVTA
jgi:intracellular sulfur oxidation DsrE/DsrF family protein